MTITVRYWENNKKMEPNYNKPYFTKKFKGKSALECMAQVKMFREDHDLVRYSIPDIVDVED